MTLGSGCPKDKFTYFHKLSACRLTVFIENNVNFVEFYNKNRFMNSLFLEILTETKYLYCLLQTKSRLMLCNATI